MTDLSDNIGLDETFDFSSTNIINDQTNTLYNGSINHTSDSFNNNFTVSSETMRILFLAIATITILVCLTICISVCVCICCNRRRQLKRQEKQEHRLLPEPSERITSTNSLPKNSKSQTDKKILSSSIQQSSSNVITGKTVIGPFYYDNLDDIPFIDESRPTSFIDITRV